MANNTAEGLRDKLFIALDGVLNKTISLKDVESVCYVSEQIIKTANVEFELIKEQNSERERERQFILQTKRDEKEAIQLLSRTIDATDNIQ